MATDTTTRDLFISGVKKYIASGVNNAPFSDWYETTNAVVQGFRARYVYYLHSSLPKLADLNSLFIFFHHRLGRSPEDI